MPKPTDSRRHRGDTERSLIIGAALILVLVGGGLILLFYGRGALFSGLLCMSGAFVIFGLLYLILNLFERISNRDE